MKYLHFVNNKSSNISYYSLFLYLIVPFWCASVAYQSRLVEQWFLPMAKPNEHDMPPKRIKKVRLGIYRTQIQRYCEKICLALFRVARKETNKSQQTLTNGAKSDEWKIILLFMLPAFEIELAKMTLSTQLASFFHFSFGGMFFAPLFARKTPAKF